jgi:hypothetical protein
VSSGEVVNYVLEDVSGNTYYYNNILWRFSNNAGSLSSKFASQYTGCCFSSDDGLWGAGTSTVDGNGNQPLNFWGQGNFNSGDSQSNSVYRDGSLISSDGTSLMYIKIRGNKPAVVNFSFLSLIILNNHFYH